MRNINELIGIIKGISFDGVVNAEETARLQEWVDKNRNLAYESYQMELINTVDAVLVDRYINDDERKQLLSAAEKVSGAQNEDVNRMFELNGIIDGIICDRRINELELKQLRSWMGSNGKVLRKQKRSEELSKAIDSVLEKNSITKEEQNSILELLQGVINDTQFSAKLDYLCKLVKEKKNIGVELIDILENESAIEEIHKEAEALLRMAIQSYSPYILGQEIIVVSLVLIAMLEYDGNYYENVREAYSGLYVNYTERKIENKIRTILSRYKKQSEVADRTRFINVALENAIVPIAFLPAFFDFIFDIYKLNFEYDISGDLYDSFLFVYEGLRDSMLSEGDELSINVTRKTYKLIAATKQLIATENELDPIIKLSIIVVKLIDKRYWDNEVHVFNPYLKAGFEAWEKQLQDDGPKEKNSVHTAGLNSRWEPIYELVNGKDVYLVPPIHKIKATYSYSDIKVEVLNNGREVYREEDSYIKEIIGGYQIRPSRIKIESPLDKVSYRLVAAEEIVYDSKDRLYRDYIVFNSNGAEIRNNTDYEGTAFFCVAPGSASGEGAMLKSENYAIEYRLVRLGDVITVGNELFSFTSIDKPGVFGEQINNCFIATDGSEELVQVYTRIERISFEASTESDKFEIIVNGKHFKLSDVNFSVMEKGGVKRYLVSYPISDSGIYILEINQFISGKKQRILKEKIAIDNELKYETISVTDESTRLDLISGLADRITGREFTAENYKEDLIRFSYEGEDYVYHLPLDLGYFSIDNGGWKNEFEDMWIGDVRLDSRMKLLDFECDGILVYSENGQLIEEGLVVRDRRLFKEVLVGFLNSYKNTNSHILLVLTANGKKKRSIICYNRCEIEIPKTDIFYSEKESAVCVSPSFHGKNKVYFEIANGNGEKVYTSKPLYNGEIEYVKELKSFENYTFSFYEKKGGLVIAKGDSIYKTVKCFYARKDYIGRVFKIETVYFNKSVRGNFEEREDYLNKAFLRITGFSKEDLFKGEIFIKTASREWRLDKVNPVEVEVCSEVVNDKQDVYITNDRDGLLYDAEKHVILESIDDKTAPDIFLYTVRVKEK